MKNYPAKALAGFKYLLNYPIVDAGTSDMIVQAVQIVLEAYIQSSIISLAEHDDHNNQESMKIDIVNLAEHDDRSIQEAMKQYTRHIPTAMRQDVLERYSNKCVECGSTSNLEIDHIIPFALGGATSTRNLQVLCRTCNRKKGDRVALALRLIYPTFLFPILQSIARRRGKSK